MDDEVPVAAVAAAAASARALMRGGEGEAVVEELAATAIAVAERFCGRTLVERPAGAWDTVPAPVRQGVAMLVQHLWEARPGEVPPTAVAALWRPYRQWGLR